MKAMVVGAAGDIGSVVCDALGDRYDIITVGRSSGDLQTDLSCFASVCRLFAQVGNLEAVISAAGEVHFAPLEDQSYETMLFGLQKKVMGQINLVLAGLGKLADSGSFTLTSGVLSRDPVFQGVGAATANGAIDGFIVGAAIEMPRGIRLNAVSPGVLDVSFSRYGHLFPGHDPVPSERVGRAYVKSVEGRQTGQIFRVE